jgi:glyoxylase-like metal-dependent hydrolase (beta-lactamase superfamily II)
MWAHSPRWRTYSEEGEPWFGFEAVRWLEGLPEEMFYIPLAGHTMGHCGVVLDTEDGWLLDAGDAYFDSREVHQQKRQCAFGVGLFQKVVTTDKEARFQNQDRLRQLIATHPEIDVFAAHDPLALPANGRVDRPTAADKHVLDASPN